MNSRVIARPTKKAEIVFESMYLEISDAWERKAKELQARRWAKINYKEKRGAHYGKHAHI